MIRRIFWGMAAAAALCAMAAPFAQAAAQAPAPASTPANGLIPADEPEAPDPLEGLLVIPFDPPAGVPFRYRVETDKYSDDPEADAKLPPPATSVQELSFGLAEGGYLLTFRTLSIERGGLTVTPQMRTGQGPVQNVLAMLDTIQVDLDPQGYPLRVKDWDAWQEKLRALPASLSAIEASKDRAEAQRIMATVVEPLLRARDEDAFAVLVKVWPDLLSWGGTALQRGVPFEFEGEIQSPVAPVLIPQSGSFSLDLDAEGNLVLELRQATAPGAVSDAVMHYLGRVRDAAADGGNKARMDRNLEEVAEQLAGAILSDHMRIVFESGTGIIRSASIERDVIMLTGTSGERSTVTMID